MVPESIGHEWAACLASPRKLSMPRGAFSADMGSTHAPILTSYPDHRMVE